MHKARAIVLFLLVGRGRPVELSAADSRIRGALEAKEERTKFNVEKALVVDAIEEHQHARD